MLNGSGIKVFTGEFFSPTRTGAQELEPFGLQAQVILSWQNLLHDGTVPFTS